MLTLAALALVALTFDRVVVRVITRRVRERQAVQRQIELIALMTPLPTAAETAQKPIPSHV